MLSGDKNRCSATLDAWRVIKKKKDIVLMKATSRRYAAERFIVEAKLPEYYCTQT